MGGLARRLGCRTRAGNRGGGLGGTTGRLGLRDRSCRDGGLLAVLLQCGDLGLQGAQGLGERQQRSRKLRHLVGQGSRRLLWEGSQTALMQAGQFLEVVLAQPFFAAIAMMAGQGQLSIR